MLNQITLQKTVLSLVSALALTFAGPASAGTDTLPAIEEARRTYYLGEPEGALLIYEQLAAAGNAEAAERAGVILLRRAAGPQAVGGTAMATSRVPRPGCCRRSAPAARVRFLCSA